MLKTCLFTASVRSWVALFFVGHSGSGDILSLESLSLRDGNLPAAYLASPASCHLLESAVSWLPWSFRGGRLRGHFLTCTNVFIKAGLWIIWRKNRICDFQMSGRSHFKKHYFCLLWRSFVLVICEYSHWRAECSWCGCLQCTYKVTSSQVLR